MADYREISQSYAQGAIKAAFILNGGASIAILSQISGLKDDISNVILGIVLLLWCIGVALSAITWVLGFISTRFVDKSDIEKNKANDLGDGANNLNISNKYLNISDKYMKWGEICIFASIAAFLIGAFVLAGTLIC